MTQDLNFKKWLNEESTSTADVATYAMPIGGSFTNDENRFAHILNKTAEFDKDPFKVCGLAGCLKPLHHHRL